MKKTSIITIVLICLAVEYALGYYLTRDFRKKHVKNQKEAYLRISSFVRKNASCIKSVSSQDSSYWYKENGYNVSLFIKPNRPPSLSIQYDFNDSILGVILLEQKYSVAYTIFRKKDTVYSQGISDIDIDKMISGIQ